MKLATRIFGLVLLMFSMNCFSALEKSYVEKFKDDVKSLSIDELHKKCEELNANTKKIDSVKIKNHQSLENITKKIDVILKEINTPSEWKEAYAGISFFSGEPKEGFDKELRTITGFQNLEVIKALSKLGAEYEKEMKNVKTGDVPVKFFSGSMELKKKVYENVLVSSSGGYKKEGISISNWSDFFHFWITILNTWNLREDEKENNYYLEARNAALAFPFSNVIADIRRDKFKISDADYYNKDCLKACEEILKKKMEEQQLLIDFATVLKQLAEASV